MVGGKGKSNEAWTTDRHPASTADLIASLHKLRAVNPKAVRPTVHVYPAEIYAQNDKGEGSSTHQDRRITSWKMTEHLYFSASNQFPTLARGLFTQEVEEGEEVPGEAEICEGEWNEQPRQRIVARGYDKFFNIDEVDWTNWEHMKRHTKGPYRLTLKSNGCLILISALTPEHVVVASKHSLGTKTEAEGEVAKAAQLMEGLSVTGGQDSTPVKASKDDQKQKGKQTQQEETDEKEAEAHAEVGRRWLRRTLQKAGKTEKTLARRLWESNTTAVLELCDDSFEEHVIATPEYWTGLHLHGLNHNTPHFSTAPPSQVTSFAEEFGFIPTKYVELESLDEVKRFTDDIAHSGSWEGDMIEGFVVRCEVGDETGPGKPPYKPGAPFFFKVKFDEPYLLYRQWREMTRTMLPLLQSLSPEKEAEVWKKVRAKVKRPEVSLYADWAAEEMKRNPALFDNYDRGVVRVRERFLEWTESSGAQAWKGAKAGNYKLKAGSRGKPNVPEVDRSSLPKKYMIVPIAVPGCGKTLIGVALSRLFGFAHTQSDDVTTKRTAPTFLANIAALFQKNDVVYADRNNHIVKHYDELANLQKEKSMRNYDLHLIGLIWDVESKPYHRLLRICSERVVKRGDNHQTLRPDLTVEAEHEAVVGNFLRNWTAPDPALFDNTLTVQMESTSRQVLCEVVDHLVKVLGVGRPSDADIDNALRAADEYRVTTPYRPPTATMGKPIRYFGVAPEIDLPATVEAILSSHPDESAQAFVGHLRTVDRFTAKPHITLVHEKTVAAEKEAQKSEEAGPAEILWNTCKSLAESPTSTMYDFNITSLVWDDRAMALALDRLHPKCDADAPELVLPDEVSLHLHVTVGTKDETIQAFESRGVVRVAREAMARGAMSGAAGEAVENGGPVRWINVQGVHGEGRVRGMF